MDIFTEQDHAFLKRIFSVYPHIGTNFDRYAAMPEDMRHDAAIEDTKALPRAGWVARQVKNPESVHDHCIRLGAWVKALELPTSLNRDRMKEMGEIHDMAEAIVTDFTPQDGITRDDKEKLELLGARLLFAAHPEKVRLVEEYIAQVTPESQLLHDLDKLEAVRQALVYEGYYPEKMGKLYPEFRDYCQPRLKTETGRAIEESLATNADQIRSDARREFLAAQGRGIAS